MKLFGAVIIVVVLVAGGVAGFSYWVWNDIHTPIYHQQSLQPVEIGRGERLDQIMRDLHEKGIMGDPFALRLYLKAKKLNPIVKAGNYYFPSPISPLQVLERLEQGGEFNRLTVVEGWTRWDIADAMSRIPSLKLPNREAALQLLDNAAPIKDLDPGAKNLEGYLFPDTYFIVSNSKPQELVTDMVKRFHEVWRSKLKKQCDTAKVSAHELVTVASIIETEAKLKEERPLIASVIVNRLKRGMPLSMDSTVVYASKMAGAWKNNGKVYKSDVDRSSPYNTRKIVGLPPGPVGSPGMSSLQAAAQPANSDYLFYVRNPDRKDGAHNFYADEKSFTVGVDALRAWEAKQKPAK